MKYSVEFSAEAERDISQLDKAVAQRLLNRIKWLTENIDHTRLEALQGKRWKGLFKLRVGDYRVLFAVNHGRKLIIVHLVGHRREIYE